MNRPTHKDSICFVNVRAHELLIAAFGFQTSQRSHSREPPCGIDMEASLFLLFCWSPIEMLIAKFCLDVLRELFKTIIHDRLGNLEHFVFTIRGISAGQLLHAAVNRTSGLIPCFFVALALANVPFPRILSQSF